MKAKMVLSYDVYRKIVWLTKNWNKEIGAYGVGKIKTDKETEDKYVYIEKLFFPKQKVSGATVFIDAVEGYSDLIKDPKFMERMGDICFYWHSHPGSASHSHTDKEDTFDTLISKESKRKWFGFLQTAWANGKLDTEARIELRQPIRATIEKGDIDLKYELPPEETALKKEMEEMLSKVIIEEPKVKEYPVVKSQWGCQANTPQTPEIIPPKDECSYLMEENKETGDIHVDNNMINKTATEQKDKAAIDIKSGGARVYTGASFKELIKDELKTGLLSTYVRKSSFNQKGDFTEIKLQPGKKMFKDMKEELLFLFDNFCRKVAGLPDALDEEETEFSMRELSYNKMELIGNTFCHNVLVVVENSAYINWTSDYSGDATDFMTGEKLGEVLYSTKFDTLMITGYKLVELAKKAGEEYLAAIEDGILEEEGEEELGFKKYLSKQTP
jgi:hypothetical protein